MVIDFRKNKDNLEPLLIDNTIVEQVSSFKFLGSLVSNDLTWDLNCMTLLTKARQRLYFLRKLKSYNVNQTILIQFYRAIVESILTNSIIVWYDRATVYHKHRLQSVVKNAQRIIGTSLPSLESLYIERMRKKTVNVLRDPNHPAHTYFDPLTSNRSFRAYKGCKRFTRSFFPEALKLYNGTRGQNT